MKRLALCIGINDYPGTDSDLAGCVNDAHDWRDALAKAGFQTSLLLDAKATGKAMRAAIAGVLQKAASGDTVVVQYSGHGSYVPDKDGDEPDGKDECFCPFDIITKGPITDDEVDGLFAKKPAGTKAVLIADSCHSGTVARFAPAAEGGRRVRFLPPSVFLPEADAKRLGPSGVSRAGTAPGKYQALLLAGCQDREYCYDAVFAGRPSGAFSHAALQALARLNENATYAAWLAEIKKALPSQDYPQTPGLFASSTMRRWRVWG